MVLDLGQATTLAELFDGARSAETKFEGLQLWYRGHAIETWPLIPSAHRRNPILESQMANHFRLRAPALRQNCPPHLDYAAWLPLMRHYGLPTRLLDWTESLTIAAFFATYGSLPSGTRAIWMLSPGGLNQHSIGEIIPFLTDERVAPLISAAFSPNSATSRNLAVVAPRQDPRMAAQLGNFTIHGSREPLENHPNADSFLAKIVIPPSAHDRLTYDLSLAGMRLSNLFPDLEHLATELSDLRAFGQNGKDLDD